MKYLNRKLSRLAVLSLLAAIATLLIFSVAFAQEEARVYVQPVSDAEGVLIVDVMAENVTDMYGAEFRLKYDPAMISVQDFMADQEGIQIEPGNMLPLDQGFVVANKVNETEGTIAFAITLLNPATPVSGSGPLARISFKLLQNGPSTINIERAKLVSFDLQTIPNQTEALVIGNDGQAPATTGSNVQSPAPGETPSQPANDNDFPWWIVAVVVIVLGILALGVFIIVGGLNVASPAPAGRTAAQGKKPPTDAMHQTGTRPSAFKN